MLKLRKVITTLVMLAPLTGCASKQVGGMTAEQAFDDPRVVELVEAAAQGEFKRIDTAILAGADVNAIGKDGITPLIWQIYLRNSKATEKLLRAGADPNYRDEKRRVSALYMAVDAGRVDILNLLLRHNGDPNLLGPDGRSLLHQSVLELCFECVELLVEKYHADVNIQLEDGDTAANYAVGMGKFSLVIYFFRHGLTANLPNLALDVQNRSVPPDSKAQEDKIKVIEVLKARGVQYPDPRYSPPKPPPGWGP